MLLTENNSERKVDLCCGRKLSLPLLIPVELTQVWDLEIRRRKKQTEDVFLYYLLLLKQRVMNLTNAKTQKSSEG